MQKTTITLPDGDVTITLEDAQRIKAAVEEYLAAERPPLDKSVTAPENASIDCEGTVRMGAWILQSSLSPSELDLTFPIMITESVRVYAAIRIKHVGTNWKALRTERITAHKQY